MTLWGNKKGFLCFTHASECCGVCTGLPGCNNNIIINNNSAGLLVYSLTSTTGTYVPFSCLICRTNTEKVPLKVSVQILQGEFRPGPDFSPPKHPRTKENEGVNKQTEREQRGARRRPPSAQPAEVKAHDLRKLTCSWRSMGDVFTAVSTVTTIGNLIFLYLPSLCFLSPHRSVCCCRRQGYF